MSRGPNGRFAPGNPGGPGNPHARRVARLKSALVKAVSPEDVAAVVAKLVEKAKGGDVASAGLLFDRLFGKPDRAIDLRTSGGSPLDGMTMEQLRERARQLGIPVPESDDLDGEAEGTTGILRARGETIGAYRLPHEPKPGA